MYLSAFETILMGKTRLYFDISQHKTSFKPALMHTERSGLLYDGIKQHADLTLETWT